MSRPAALLLAVAACGSTVDPEGLPSIDGFDAWSHRTTTEVVPGHGDTRREIYVNDVGRSYPHAGQYPVGTVIVKDVRDSGTGDRRYLAIMRKLSDRTDDTYQNGWLFSTASDPGDTETHRDSCFDSCHLQAPVDHAWLDYGD